MNYSTEYSLQYNGIQHGSGVGEEVYDGAATVGKVTSWFYLICAILIAVVLCISGFYCVFKNDDDEWEETTATVETATCTKQVRVDKENGSTSTTYNCTLTLGYKVGDKVYTEKSFSTGGSTKYVKGYNLTIKYKIANPEEIKTDSVSSSLIGYGSSGCAVLILLGAGLNWYLSSKSKLYAAASGTGTIINAVF